MKFNITYSIDIWRHIKASCWISKVLFYFYWAHTFHPIRRSRPTGQGLNLSCWILLVCIKYDGNSCTNAFLWLKWVFAHFQAKLSFKRTIPLNYISMWISLIQIFLKLGLVVWNSRIMRLLCSIKPSYVTLGSTQWPKGPNYGIHERRRRKKKNILIQSQTVKINNAHFLTQEP